MKPLHLITSLLILSIIGLWYFYPTQEALFGSDSGARSPGTMAYVSYGGSTELWGETWADTDINDADFGFVISATRFADGEGTPTVSVDHIRITVYYTEAAGGGSQTMVSPVIIFE